MEKKNIKTNSSSNLTLSTSSQCRIMIGIQCALIAGILSTGGIFIHEIATEGRKTEELHRPKKDTDSVYIEPTNVLKNRALRRHNHDE